ncbi:MAG: DUF2293 domain-containing protein [Bradymonadaceae bacterium]|nr:DUF2293 domain-containing protein [Lujinxingiaceae bacterium]
MPDQTRNVSPSFPYDTVRFEDGTKAAIPQGWALLPPGDATLTRRVKAAGPSWTVQEKKGRKTFSHGVWAPAANIEAQREKTEAERETPEYARKRATDLARKEKKHEEYVEDFCGAVLSYLNFNERFATIAKTLAEAVTVHATPVGSGTVARTERIPIEERAEAAVIAWMRHQTTAYDDMRIARVKGKRREVRRELAKRSKALLQSYRDGVAVAGCPLQKALEQRG